MPIRQLARLGLFTAMLAFCPPAFGDDAPRDQWLPLGDGKVSNAPRKGHVFACQRTFRGGGGAHRSGEWLRGDTWNPRLKPIVEGDVSWPDAAISVTREGDRRIISSNHLPSHRTGVFPIDPDSTAYAFDRNPNAITGQEVLLTLPANPEMADEPSCVPMGMIGFTLSGGAIFNAFDLGGRDAPAYEIQDKCNGHPERSGAYHYHDWSPCLADKASDEPVGFMLDGFPILGPVDARGREWASADLDECHGTTGPVFLDGRIVRMYHYRFTRDFPYTIGCFRGRPTSP
jgi:hypothetical protein